MSAALTAVMLAMPLGACAAPQQKPGAPYHHTTEGFRNPPGSPVKNPTLDRLPWLFKRITGGFPKGEVPPGHVLPKEQAKADLEAMTGDTVTWIGHMTALLRLDGKTVLTDPW
ncbi:MAG: hypothetical protein MI741_01335, partial [Rhodospirillales bacterium]|nr:hypothetical protein [Rhodospirillales bacterium]